MAYFLPFGFDLSFLLQHSTAITRAIVAKTNRAHIPPTIAPRREFKVLVAAPKANGKEYRNSFIPATIFGRLQLVLV